MFIANKIMRATKKKGLEYVGGAILPVTGNSTPSISLTSLVGGLASSPAKGDLVVAMMAARASAIGTGANQDLNMSASGYIELLDLYANYGTVPHKANLFVGRKFMGASPDVSVSFNAGDAGATTSVIGVSVWRGADPTTPVDVAIQSATGAGTGRPDPPAITPITKKAIILAGGVGAAGLDLTDIAQAGSQLSNFLTDTSDGGSNHITRLAFGHYDGWETGSFNPAAFVGADTYSGSSWAAFSLALRPA